MKASTTERLIQSRCKNVCEFQIWMISTSFPFVDEAAWIPDGTHKLSFRWFSEFRTKFHGPSLKSFQVFIYSKGQDISYIYAERDFSYYFLVKISLKLWFCGSNPSHQWENQRYSIQYYVGKTQKLDFHLCNFNFLLLKEF